MPPWPSVCHLTLDILGQRGCRGILIQLPSLAKFRRGLRGSCGRGNRLSVSLGEVLSQEAESLPNSAWGAVGGGLPQEEAIIWIGSVRAAKNSIHHCYPSLVGRLREASFRG